MSETKNLKLFKHDEPLETNENKFDIDLALNQNWDKIDKFADTVDNKVTNLQEQNTKLEEKIKKDRENMINLEVEGQSIHIEDASDLEGQLEVLGNVEQETTGKNLLNNTAKTTTVNGVTFTVNEDGTVIANGTATSLAQISLVANIKLPAGAYTIKDGKAYIESVDFNGWFDGLNVASTVTFNTEVLLKNVYIQIKQGETVSNKTFYPQIEKGTKATEYEQYIEKPTPEHNSEIRAVGDNINLWDKENMLIELGGYSGSNGNKYDSTTRIRNTKDIELKKDTYTLSAEDSKLISVYIVNLKKEISSNGDSATFILEEDGTIRFTIENTALLNTKIKLERGNKKTSYSEFGQGSVEIKKTSANYYNVKSYAGSNPPLVDKDDWITLTGNNTGTSAKYLNYFTENLNLNIDENYWIVAEIKESSGEGNFSITSRMNNQGQFDTHTVSVANLKAGDKVIYKATALKTEGAEHGLRTFISLSQGESCNITFRLSVLETEPNKSNWKYVPYKKENKILPIQKPMLEGDYFIKETDGWKEVHNWAEVKLIGTENWTASTLIVAGYFGAYLKIQDVPKNAELYCNYFKKRQAEDWHKLVAQNFIYAENGSIGIRINNKFCENLESFKNWLKSKNDLENSVYVYYKKETLTKLSCTPEQTKILDELDNFQTYKPVTNITTDSIAKLKLKYIADTKTYIDNKTSNLEQQVNTINQLLSTTKTSSVLLDNLQKDIEREVL
jgi:hypothetical protein|nr:MAG TPA: hypothetical protein [Caudoviricetes sp.]